MPSSDLPLALEPLACFEAAREPWQALSQVSGNLFSTWEWASIWWRHFGGGRRLRLTACRRGDGTLAAILPLYEARRGPVGLLRFMGHGPADQLGPVCSSEDRPAVADALTRSIGRTRLLLAERLPGAAGWPARLGAPVVRREPSPRLEIHARTWDEHLATQSSNFRQQVRRRERKLVREHGLRYRLAVGQTLEADLDVLFRLHDLRWEGEGGSRFSRERAFHREFAGAALERGWLRLWLAEIEERPVAAWYGFRFADADWYYQAGRDPRWEQQAIGFVLLAHTVREAVDAGMSEYKLLLGGESYKDRFASDDPGLDTLLVGSRLAGTVTARAVTGFEGLSPVARRRVTTLARRVGLRRR